LTAWPQQHTRRNQGAPVDVGRGLAAAAALVAVRPGRGAGGPGGGAGTWRPQRIRAAARRTHAGQAATAAAAVGRPVPPAPACTMMACAASLGPACRARKLASETRVLGWGHGLVPTMRVFIWPPMMRLDDECQGCRRWAAAHVQCTATRRRASIACGSIHQAALTARALVLVMALHSMAAASLLSRAGQWSATARSTVPSWALQQWYAAHLLWLRR